MNLKFDFTVGFAKPPVTTNLYKFQDLDLDVLGRIKSCIHETNEKLKDDKEVSSEAEILRKLHYKFKNQWRREKVLKSIKQVHNVWLKFKSIDLIELLDELKDLVPNRVFGRETTHLPSFFLVCYDLSIMLRACALLKAASDLCIVGCERAEQQINNYLFAQYMTICYATLSKFCSLCKTLLDTLSECYKSIRDLSQVLQVPPTLLKGFKALPRDVKPWLESDSFFSFHISSLFSLKQESEVSSGPDNMATTAPVAMTMQPDGVAKALVVATAEETQMKTDSSLSSTTLLEQDPKGLKTSAATTTTTMLVTSVMSQEETQLLSDLTNVDDNDEEDENEGEDDDDDHTSAQQQNETATTNDMTNNKKRKLKINENHSKKKSKTESIGESPHREALLPKAFVPSISREEMEEISSNVDGCSTVGQLLSIIRELKSSKKGIKMKGFKICSNKLKSMKEEVKCLNSNSHDNGDGTDSKKTRKRLITKSKTLVKKFLTKNLS